MGRRVRHRDKTLFFLLFEVHEGGRIVADVHIEDGIIRIKDLDIQDFKSAKVLAEYPETRWPEITRRALKIGLGYLQGGAEN